MATGTPVSSGSKKKQPKSDFIRCEQCSIVLLSKDRAKHQHGTDGFLWQSQEETDENQKLDNTDYDFIADGTLFGTVRELQSNDELLGDLSMCLQRQILFMSPFTLQMTDIAVNDYVVVSNAQGHTFLRIAWSHISAPLMTVCPLLPCKELPTASRLQIKRFKGKLVNASVVELEQLHGLEISQEIQSLVLDRLRRVYDSTTVHPGEELRCDHYCEWYSFRVEHAKSEISDIEESITA
ncbi:hypothetical protein BIW11_13003, partial [Tropilaelaps mercedesae]